MEESWTIEEVDFNIKGLSLDCFLPPADLKKADDQEGCHVVVEGRNAKLPFKISAPASSKVSAAKVVAIDLDDSYSMDDVDDEDDL